SLLRGRAGVAVRQLSAMSHSDPTPTAQRDTPRREAGATSGPAASSPEGAAPAGPGAGATPDGGRLVELFASRGFARIEPPILQPLGPFSEFAGEELRRRMFVTTDADGHEWCLRPEYTIPVSRQHLARQDAPASAAYAYLGPVFRFRPGETGEFRQAGIEDF